jgi:hypothetical protein
MSKTNNPDLVRRVAEQKERVEDRSDLAEAREALAEIEKEGTISWERVKADLKL